MAARFLLLALLLLPAGGAAVDPAPRPEARTRALVRARDFQPLFQLAVERVEGSFDPEGREAFLDEVFGIPGKWKAVTRGRESYERYVRKAFERCVHGPEDFERLVEAVRRDYEYATAAAHNRLLGAVYEDLRLERPELTLEAFRAEASGLAASLAPQVARDLGLNLVSIAGSEAAAALLTAALTSAGLLGSSAAAGAAAGPWTFGVGLVAGIAAGAAIDLTIGESFEEAARLEVRGSVDALRNRLLDAVLEALARATAAFVETEERCVEAMYARNGHARLPARA